MREIGLKIRLMDGEFISIRMGQFTKANGKMISKKVKEFKNGQMENIMKEIIKTVLNMGMVFYILLMAVTMTDNLIETRFMVKVNCL